MPRIIFHIDVNSAFVSFSAVKLLKEGKPDIRLFASTGTRWRMVRIALKL